MDISGTHVIAAPPVAVLNALFTRHVLVRSIPGDGQMDGELKAGPADIAGQLPSGEEFTGQVALARSAEPYVLDGVVDLSTGSLTASATLTLRLVAAASSSTRLNYEVHVAGTSRAQEAEVLVREAIGRIIVSLESEVGGHEGRPLPLADAPPLAPGSEAIAPTRIHMTPSLPEVGMPLGKGQSIPWIAVLLVIVLLVTVLN